VGNSSMYEILELTSDATMADIKSAYRRLASQVHPDLGGSKALFRLVQDAYETLTGQLGQAQADAAVSSPVATAQLMPSAGKAGRDDRVKWVNALLAQERALAPRICVTA
jgi:DnaJ-class molecular chaperone